MSDLKKLLDEATPGTWSLTRDNDIKSEWTVTDDDETYTESASIATGECAQNCGYIHWGNPADARLAVAAVNAVPELLALREEVGRLREQVRELSDCQPLPKVYKYTGTAEVDVENMFDVGHRHVSGKHPRDYLMSWLSMFRPFAYATKDDSWGELEKLISIVMNNYVQILVRAEKARAALNQEGGQ